MAKKGYFSAKNVAWRELPSGYTQVEYIESSGTQYINTGFIPNQDTRVVMEAEHSVTSAGSWLFGARTASGKNMFAFLAYSNKYRTDYNATYNSYYAESITNMTRVDKNKNTTILNDAEVITQTYAAFDCQYPLFLLAIDTAGTASGFASVELKKVQIYDNGTLVRDYVPCKNASGAAGLYDMVNGVFYGNAGTGSFLAGDEVHSDVAREPKKLYFSDNGVARLAKKAYFGDENGIARLCYPNGFYAGTLAVGSSVFMNVNGARTEFLVVQQGLPDATLYDASCDGTWLLMKDIYSWSKWSNGVLNYSESYIDNYLETTLLGLFDEDVKNVIKTATIYSRTGNTSSYYPISRKIFLLSANEVNGENSQLLETKSSVLDYFNGASNTERIAYFKGAATAWWLRNYYANKNPTYVLAAGGVSHSAATNEFGVRPALILPSDAQIDENFNVLA